MAQRTHNFSAGPAVLPVPVLEQVQADLLDWRGSGMSVMEMSHRSKHFEGILAQAEADLRELLGIPADYAVIFMQGGATQQFAMLPMNFLPAGGSADYIVAGSWGQAAFKEARKFGQVRAAATTEAGNFNRMPAQSELDLDPQAAYLHFTSNETIHGVETPDGQEPQPPAGVPLVCDASSDFLSRPLEVSKYAYLYGGAQKNLGPAGVTLGILRRDLLERVPAGRPLMMDYKVFVEKQSMYNTPPCFSIYVVGLVLQWIKGLGGLEAMRRRNTEKAARLYAAIDGSGGFYRGHAEPASRSRMNITFRLSTPEMEKAFVKQALAQGMDNLSGHRSVGGLRASLYNAQTLEAVEALIQFMTEFQQANG